VQIKYLSMKVMWGFEALGFLGIVGIFIVSGFLIHRAVEQLKRDATDKESYF
jgi:hypothetical protein